MSSKLVLHVAAIIGLVLPGTATAAPPPSPSNIANAINAQRLPLSRDADGRFSGVGWQRLIADAATADMTMVGEQHGSGSIAEFETMLHKTLAGRGYTHSVLELGPYSTAFAESLIRRRSGALAAYIATPGNGFSMPFLSLGEEARMAEQMVALSPDPKHALWGVDQEFIGGGPIHVALLAEHARSPAQRNAVAALRTAVQSNPFHAGMVGDAELAPLRRAFAGDKEAVGLLDSMSASSAIYRPFVQNARGDIYAANLAREAMMKRNFVVAFSDAERRLKRTPKLFFKFGANHAMRGHSNTDVPAFGNFLAEWGASRGLRMVNVLVECDGGQALNLQSGKPEACAAYFDEDSALRRAVRSGPPLQMFDLRPLRAQLALWKELDPGSRKVILAFDYYVTIRDGRAATPLGAPPVMPKAGNGENQ